MKYADMMALKKGDRIRVNDGFGWRIGTFHGFVSGSDPAAWIAFDAFQKYKSEPVLTKVYTGLQFKEIYWNEIYGNKHRFQKVV